MTYRSPNALAERQGRRMAGPSHLVGESAWSSRTPYRVETYLEHAADVFAFDARAYITLTGAMDHHDLLRCPTSPSTEPWSLERITAEVQMTAIDSDVLVPSEEIDDLERLLQRANVRTVKHVLSSDKGHDAFLGDTEKLTRLLKKLMEPIDLSV